MSYASRRDRSLPTPLFPEPAFSPRLFSPDDGAENFSLPQFTSRPSESYDFSPDWKLRQFVEGVIEREKPAVGTVRRWRDSLSHWERLTFDPDIKEICQDVCDRFAEAIMLTEGMVNNTRRTHCVQIGGFLSRLAKPSKRYRRAVGWFETAPWLEAPPLEVIRGATKHQSLEEIGRWIVAARLLPAPRKPLSAPTPLFLEAIAITDYNTGMRISELMEARWEWMGSDDRFAWIDLPPLAVKRGRRSGHGRRVPLNEHALRAIDSIGKRTGTSGKIFDWNKRIGRLDRLRKEVFVLAGMLRPDQKPPKRFGFHGWRQAGAHQIAKINPHVKAMFLGHSSGGSVTSNFYTPWEELAEAVEKLPQPKFTSWNDRLQLQMF